MNHKAMEMGANGVVGIDIDYGTIGDTGSMLMVSVNGTAVKYWCKSFNNNKRIHSKHLIVVNLENLWLADRP